MTNATTSAMKAKSLIMESPFPWFPEPSPGQEWGVSGAGCALLGDAAAAGETYKNVSSLMDVSQANADCENSRSPDKTNRPHAALKVGIAVLKNSNPLGGAILSNINLAAQ